MKRSTAGRIIKAAKIGVVCASAIYLANGIVQFNEAENEPGRTSNSVWAVQATEPAAETPRTESAETKQQPTEPEGMQQEYQSIVCSRDWDEYDGYLLAKIAMAEAEGEDREGKALVIMVVLNRVWSDEFPASIEEVIFQEDQFSPVGNGRWDTVEPDKECYEALDMVMNGWDQSYGATYFESESDSTWHQQNLEYLFQHGSHFFYKEKEE